MPCANLETVNLSGLDLTHLTSYTSEYGYMFNGCNNIKKIILGNISQTSYTWWSTLINDYGWGE